MEMNQSTINRLMRSKNPLTYIPINFLFGEYFFKRFYSLNNTSFFNKPMISLSFDNDHEEDYSALPLILNMLDKFQIKSSFAVIGKFIEKYPDQHAQIIRRGHELINHTYSHPFNPQWNPHQRFNKLSSRDQEHEITRCHKVAKNILKYEMRGFRIPHFQVQFTPTIYPILSKLQYHYSSSIKANRSPNQWRPYREEGNIIEIPLTTCIKHPLQSFDSYHAFRKGAHNSQNAFIDLFRQMVNINIENNAYINLYLDPQDFGGNNISCLESLLNIIKSSDLQYSTYTEILPKVKTALLDSVDNN